MNLRPISVDPVTGYPINTTPGFPQPGVHLPNVTGQRFPELLPPNPPRIQVRMRAEGSVARALRAAFVNHSEVTMTVGYVQECSGTYGEAGEQNFTIEFANMELHTRVDTPPPLQHIQLNVVVSKEGVTFEKDKTLEEEPVKKSRYDLIKENK